MSVFYDTYGASKSYTTPSLNQKHITKFDNEVGNPIDLKSTHRCLEIGCGTGHFLSYLHHKDVTDLHGIDLDASLSDVVAQSVRDHFEAADVWGFLKTAADKPKYDRIFMFDVFEHFLPEEGHKLLSKIGDILNEDGVIILKMPNASSPWGLQYQNGDLTHLANYTPDSIRQMAVSCQMTCTQCYPHLLGSKSRQWRDRVIQKFLNWAVATPPEIWEGNFYAVIKKLR